jgi:hypothetical protein
MISLDALALEFNTDKSSRDHNYTPMYEHWMSSKRDLPINMVEIGVGLGGSARMWRSYFPSGKIVMIDNFKEFASSPRAIPGVVILEGNQDDELVWRDIPDELDFVIDDGSHKPQDCIASVMLGFEKLKSGGLWFIEDTHCNFTPVFSSHDQLYPWIFELEHSRQLSNLGTGDFYKSFMKVEGLASEVYSIHLYKSVIVLQKK